MRLNNILTLTLIFWAGFANADTIGVYAGIGTWSQDYSGTVAADGEDIDIDGDFDLSSKRNTLLYVALEHPVPVLPNLKFQKSSLATSGDNVLSADIEWRGVTYAASESVATDIDIDQMDLVAYYELLDNVVSLDLGLAARYMDGVVDVRSTAAAGVAEFKGVVPMLYTKARVDLPSGFWLGGEAQGLGWAGHSVIDANAHLGWTSKWGFGFEAGWRMLNLNLDEIDELTGADIEIKGPYAALNFHF